jgi:50S ribosomal protein L16 3-hydroxylase|tara:strand:- start:8065 stop:9249 length:1185 start_codon:yes stop_codon:yes gene_type:complete
VTNSIQPDNTPLEVLGGISAQQFLNEYWQQKPLLVRNAFPNWENPLLPDELAGLACEQNIESRVITGSRATNQWNVITGPFQDDSFTKLGEQDWTLLVQATDQWVPEVEQLKQPFRFIPDWRMDDVMTSFAAPNGSVGPHYDQYDVFLIQGDGQRRWRLGQHCDSNTELLANNEVKILKYFQGTEDWTLNPGDLLYVPPGLAHWGTAITPCMTYSVGFRGPSHAELLVNYSDEVISHLDESMRYSDIGHASQDNPGEITAQSLTEIKTIINQLITNDDLLAEWFGRYVTELKDDRQSYLDDEQAEQVIALLQTGSTLDINPITRLAFSFEGDTTRLFVNGETISQTGAAWLAFVEQLCLNRWLSEPDLSDSQVSLGIKELVTLNCLYLGDNNSD